MSFDRDVIISPANEYEVLQLLMGDCRDLLSAYEGAHDESVLHTHYDAPRGGSRQRWLAPCQRACCGGRDARTGMLCRQHRGGREAAAEPGAERGRAAGSRAAPPGEAGCSGGGLVSASIVTLAMTLPLHDSSEVRSRTWCRRGLRVPRAPVPTMTCPCLRRPQGTLDAVRRRLAPIRGIPTKKGGMKDPDAVII